MDQDNSPEKVASNAVLGLSPEAIGHLHSNGEFCQERAVASPVWWPVAMFTEDQMAEAVAAVRERCALVIEVLAEGWDDPAEAYGMKLAASEARKA